MIKALLMALTIVASFFLGFAYKSNTINHTKDNTKLKRVTGIGGIFSNAKIPKK